ncbi:toxin ParE1/3/4 [Nonlabens sp. Hel1_33_55]|uniref:type II toxin-antitoxin system RelE/ParE family toxin n=1 Tax=Nonlabens sp. Hel1_33_55 TaxID=1336802 RepID=UPI000875AAD5|nr:type II toxin-antitoxin system RelE/ParE family toxin [Nonlabens sp. Hel1_33_55]SCY10018.1 toxin ParE1/3/4 [Nonlabens sp. Hel1_33_55]
MKYKISTQAQNDLTRIYLYGVKKFGYKQAQLYSKKLIECINSISNNPTAYVAVDHVKPNYRRCSCGSDSIYYKVSHIVEIMAVLGSQDIENAL